MLSQQLYAMKFSPQMISHVKVEFILNILKLSLFPASGVDVSDGVTYCTYTHRTCTQLSQHMLPREQWEESGGQWCPVPVQITGGSVICDN
jgi:hypothetical protein